jgi:hypothetical protein
MGYAFIYGPCVACERRFVYHPNKVPSVRVNGKREPICQGCVDKYNPIREKNGLEPIKPLPGAYGPGHESEI